MPPSQGLPKCINCNVCKTYVGMYRGTCLFQHQPKQRPAHLIPVLLEVSSNRCRHRSLPSASNISFTIMTCAKVSLPCNRFVGQTRLLYENGLTQETEAGKRKITEKRTQFGGSATSTTQIMKHIVGVVSQINKSP